MGRGEIFAGHRSRSSRPRHFYHSLPCGALRNPDSGANSIVVDLLLNYLCNDFYQARSVNFDQATIPAYFGGDWGIHGMHLPGDIRAFEKWKGPKKVTIGPPVYLDRPVYQYAYESLRWFDYWLKGIDTGIMDEPPRHGRVEVCSRMAAA